MTDLEFLNSQSRLVRQRLSHGTTALREELETTLAPVVREHPRSSLAAGAAAGVLLGRLLTPAPRAASAARGPIAGAWSFTRGTIGFALRSSLVGSIRSLFATDPTEPG